MFPEIDDVIFSVYENEANKSNYLCFNLRNNAWVTLGSINSSPVHRLISSPKIL